MPEVQGQRRDILVERDNDNLFTADGWINSGDLGRLDDDEYLWLSGRAKDVIIRGGHNIEPSIIEEALLRHPAVVHAVAVGMPDSYAGELPVAYVQLAAPGACSEEELKHFVKEHISERPAIPAEIFLVDEIPLSDVRKPLKAVLRRDAARRTFSRLIRDAVPARNTIDVEIEPDPQRGDVVVVRSSTLEQPEIASIIARIMAGFSSPYKIVWSAPP